MSAAASRAARKRVAAPDGAATAGPGHSRWLVGAVIIALALSVVGVGVAAYLAVENLQGEAGVCAIAHGCSTVQKSQYGKMFGIPISVPGLALYAAMAAISLGWLLDFRGLRPHLTVLGFYGALAGTAFSGYLTYLEANVIDAWCIYCIVSALLMTALLALWAAVLVPTVRARGA